MIGAITFHPVKDVSEWIGMPDGARKRLVIHRSTNASGGRIGRNNFYNSVGQLKLFTIRIGIFPIQPSLSILIVALRFLMKHAASMSDEKPDEPLSILRACDHFREWQSLDDERVCVVCDRSFNGHEVRIVMIGNDYRLHCPTSACESGVHQWVYRGNPLLSDAAYADWWRALGSTECGPVKPQSHDA